MIQILISITESDGNIKVDTKGGDTVKASRKEVAFTRKYISYLNRFNTDYRKVHPRNKITMQRIKR